MERLLWICLAGALGTGVRYLVGLWVVEKLGSAFPYATLCVNVAGCFVIALVAELALRTAHFPLNLRLALTTGFTGGLTTYSTYAYESVQLIRHEAPGAALLNFVLTTLACLVAVALGIGMASLLLALRTPT